MTYTFSDPNSPFVFSDEDEKPVPLPQAAPGRAKKAHYALGPDSPGEDSLFQSLSAGDEGVLRRQAAFNEDIKYEGIRNGIVSQLAQQAGRNLSPAEMEIVYGLSKQDIQNDPASILEKKFADRYINDVIGMTNVYQGFDTGTVADEANVAANVVHSKEYFQTRLEDVQSEWQKQGLISSVADVVGNMIPFLPWWRQAQALSERKTSISFLMGSTIKENVQYLYSLPFEERKRQYEKALDYLKSKNTLDALTFAQAMVAYPTSDEYLANTVSLADYGTASSFVTKLAGRLLPAAKPTRTAVSTVEDIAKATDVPAKPVDGTVAPVARPVEPKQLDLFGEQPEQGSFRFMETPPKQPGAETPQQSDVFYSPFTKGITPDYPEGPASGLGAGPGKLRATYVPQRGEKMRGRDLATGRIYKEPTQQELPLGTAPQHQASFDLRPPSPPRISPEVLLAEANAPQATKELRHALADAVKAVEGHKPPQVEEVLGAMGHADQAGFVGALKRILNPLEAGNADLAKEVPTFANPGGFLRDSTVIGRARAQILTPELIKQGERLIDNFVDLARVSRLPAEALQIAKANAETVLRKEYSRVSDSIFDVVHTPAELHPANVDTVSLKLGKPGMELFDSRDQAELFRREVYGLGDKEALVRQQGYKWYLEVPKHVDETADNVRSTLITPKNATNASIINMLLSRVRSAEDLLSPLQREARHLATHAPQEIKKTLRDFIKENIESLDKSSRRAVEDILRLNRDMPSTKFPGERGRWFDTAGEFEQAFLARHQRMPTEKEVLAYDAFKRVSDFDWLLRNVNVYRDKARQGIEQFRFSFEGSQSAWFEGKQLDAMPWKLGNADQDAGIWIWNSESKTGKFFYKYNMTDEERKAVDLAIQDKGYRVVQIFDPKRHPLQGIAKTATGEDLKDQVNYVITNTWERSPMSWKQVDYRPGGHVIYPHKWYVSQPTIQIGRNGKATYFGDSNILNIETEAQAKKWAERIDHGRQLLKLGREAELSTYVSKNLPYSLEEFKKLFTRADSPLSLDHPVTYKSSGKNTISTDAKLKSQYDNGNLIDSTKNVHDLSNWMDKAYLADRDNVLSTVMESGNSMRLGPAEQLDPYVALNRAVGQGIQNVWMTDYKIGAVESWIKEFEHVMQPTDKTLLSHPLFFLFNPQWKNVSEAARADLAAAKAAQRAIVNFIGAKSELSGALDTVKMKALNYVYDKAGQGKLLDLALATTSDPVSFLRGVAFHSKLGMFNPVQFFVQAQSMVHSIAVAGPTHGLPGFAAAPLIRALGHNPNQLDTVAGVASKLGWTKDGFKEMYTTFQKTGLYQVAGEAALRDDMFDPHLFRTTVGKYVLDAGPMFFNEGERMTRLTAFATAFREWRAANPVVTIGNREIGQILRRSDDLSVNMTRASNAAWQEGVFSVPTQFFAYNARVMEQLLGGRLTGAEKLRMLTVYSTMYGLPIGAGMAVGGIWPVYDSIKQEAMKRGVDLNEGAFKLMTEGLLAYSLELLTGKQSNVPQRYGPGNNQLIKDAIDGDKAVPEIMFGASGTIIKDIVATAHPFWYKVASVVDDNGEYPLTTSDWLTMFRNISTVDTAAKAYAASVYGKWYTKNGTAVSAADGMDGALAILGLSPRSVSDTFLQLKANKQTSDSAAIFEKDILNEFRRGMQAGAAGDTKGMENYFKRARTLVEASDLNTADKARLFNRIADQNRDLADKVKWDALKHAPASRYNQMFENYYKNRQ